MLIKELLFLDKNFTKIYANPKESVDSFLSILFNNKINLFELSLLLIWKMVSWWRFLMTCSGLTIIIPSSLFLLIYSASLNLLFFWFFLYCATICSGFTVKTKNLFFFFSFFCFSLHLWTGFHSLAFYQFVVLLKHIACFVYICADYDFAKKLKILLIFTIFYLFTSILG